MTFFTAGAGPIIGAAVQAAASPVIVEMQPDRVYVFDVGKPEVWSFLPDTRPPLRRSTIAMAIHAAERVGWK